MTTELEKQCEFFYKNNCNIYAMTCDYSDFCKQNEECFVKKILSKLQAKEKECNQLKVELKAEKNKLFLPTCYEQLYKEAKEMNNDIAKKCFDLEKENKQLKAEVEELKEELILKEIANIELSDEVKKYRKAIDEIEEISDNNYEIAEMEQIFLIIGGLDV